MAFSLRLSVLFLFIMPIEVFSQGAGSFKKTLESTGLNFKQSEGFISSDTTQNFMPIKNVLLSWSNCSLISEKKDLIIYTSIIKFDTAGTDFIRKRINPKYDRHNNYLRLISSKIDSTVSRVKYFGADTVAKFHASVAGIYTMRVEHPYKGVYKKAKVLFISKKDAGDVELVYFYRDGADIDGYISKTLFAFTFKE